MWNPQTYDREDYEMTQLIAYVKEMSGWQSSPPSPTYSFRQSESPQQPEYYNSTVSLPLTHKAILVSAANEYERRRFLGSLLTSHPYSFSSMSVERHRWLFGVEFCSSSTHSEHPRTTDARSLIQEINMVDVKQSWHIPWSKHSANKELTQTEVITLIAHHNNVTYEEAETRLNQQGFFDKLTEEQSGDVIEHVRKRMELRHTEDNDEEKYLEEFSDDLCSALQRGRWDDVVYHLEETISMTPLSESNEKDIKRAIKMQLHSLTTHYLVAGSWS